MRKAECLRGRVAAMQGAFKYMMEQWFCHESCWGTDERGRDEAQQFLAAFTPGAGQPEAEVIVAANKVADWCIQKFCMTPDLRPSPGACPNPVAYSIDGEVFREFLAALRGYRAKAPKTLAGKE